MNLIKTVYGLILFYFIIGFLSFYFINRKKDREASRKSWVKTIIYFFIINIIAASIVFFPVAFRCISIIVIIGGFYELFVLYKKSGYRLARIFYSSVLIFGGFSVAFFVYSGLNKEKIFFTFALVSIFDSFSQITGELFGKIRLLPHISPNKTVEGFIGGSIITLLSVILLRVFIDIPLLKLFILAAEIIIFTFIGDLSTSYYKRKYKVKDFSRLIPGHGGILDRFDSLIAGGAWVALASYIT
jgi:phosphatidate cytidylyltransferase